MTNILITFKTISGHTYFYKEKLIKEINKSELIAGVFEMLRESYSLEVQTEEGIFENLKLSNVETFLINEYLDKREEIRQ